MFIGSLGFFIAMIIGQKVNSKIFYTLSKSSLFNLINIKSYAGRSIVASAIGETVYIMIVFPIAFYKTHTISAIISAALFSLVFKIILSCLLAKPSQIISNRLGPQQNSDYSCSRVRIDD